MEQSLLTKVQADLAQQPNFVVLSEEILDLGKKLKGLIMKDEIKDLYGC
jgi:hypothetical protein